MELLLEVGAIIYYEYHTASYFGKVQSPVSVQTSSQVCSPKPNLDGTLIQVNSVLKAPNNPGLSKYSHKQNGAASASPETSPHGLVWCVWCELSAVEHSPVLQLRRKVLI